jgi:hypothetical protein
MLLQRLTSSFRVGKHRHLKTQDGAVIATAQLLSHFEVHLGRGLSSSQWDNPNTIVANGLRFVLKLRDASGLGLVETRIGLLSKPLLRAACQSPGLSTRAPPVNSVSPLFVVYS